jgi:hypothetical protein
MGRTDGLRVGDHADVPSGLECGRTFAAGRSDAVAAATVMARMVCAHRELALESVTRILEIMVARGKDLTQMLSLPKKCS